MGSRLCDTALTGDLVAKCLKDSLGPRAILVQVEGERIAIDHGRSSHILRLKLTWEGEDETLPKTAVIKTPTVETITKFMNDMLDSVDEKERLKAIYARGITLAHNAECRFYDLMGKTPPIAVPKIYATVTVTENRSGMLIMEDLSEKASIPPSVAVGLTYQQTLAALTQVARLQAWCLTTSVDWRREVYAMEDQEQLWRGWYASIRAGLQATKDKVPSQYGSIDVEKLSTLCSYETLLKNMNEHRHFMADVIVIMDFHINNIMYEKVADGRVNDHLVAMVDFQGVVRGCPTRDVANLLCFSIHHKLRHEHEEDFLRYYYNEVKSLAGDKFSATFDQIHRLYKRQFVFAAVHLLAWGPVMGPVVLIKSEGEQKEKENKELLDTMKAAFDDAMKIWNETL